MGGASGGPKESAAERLASELRRRILSGELTAGLRLPPERTLAVEWDANRHTVREALRILEAQGLLETRQGSGAVVLDFRTRGRLELAPYYFEAVGLHPALKSEIEAFLTMRRAVLTEAVALAAQEGSLAAKQSIAALARELAAAKSDSRRVAELDFALYRLVIEATGRLIYRWVLNSFAERVQPLIEAFAFIWPRPEIYFVSIANMADRIVAGEAKEAREAARAHLEETDRQIMEAISLFLEAGLKQAGQGS